jgi:uncharacterized membrane protein YagU involved in acid resistance
MSGMPQRLVTGAAAGFTATEPMTLTMEDFRVTLPRRKQDPLEPRQITTRALEFVGFDNELSDRQQDGLTAFNHVGYGTTAGAVCRLLADVRLPLPPAVCGVTYGLAVWAGGYPGWLPATGLMPQVTRQPRDRVMLQVVAHIVWEVALGTIFGELDGGREGES